MATPQPTSRRSNWLLVLGIIPAALGLVGTIAGLLAGERGTLHLGISLPWVPLIVGIVLSLVLGPTLAALLAGHRRVARVRADLHREETASRRRLIARLDHEIKNPIQGIRAALADEESGLQRASIDAQSQRLAGLLSDLRKIGEVEDAELELGPLDLTALVEEAVVTLEESTEVHRRRLTVALPRAPRPLPSIVGDEDLLFLAVLNVLSNAVKYSEDGDAVEVRGHLDEDDVVLEIADTGRGIAADEIPLVWEELGRSAETRGIEGAGLGLPMVRAIIERHGGTASLESWHGEGSTVSLRLPVAGPGVGRPN